ncbi:MAG TPA: glycosyltransferase family 2 protein [Candidatus Andersenbacteria bacterium]|nr:MAG: Glycosyl transferase family 2 [Parcubacteria group bacterium GW2011_GWA2_45_14]HBE90441.1 glycosyltransferase family 2 protein [Candidatus Andersenbacteria bacterium]
MDCQSDWCGMMAITRSLSVVLPMFNEERAITGTLENVSSYLTKSGALYEIIVVDDGSKDGSVGAVNSLIKKGALIKLIQHSHNQGYGEALWTGFNAARLERILLMDSDGQFRIESVEQLWPFADEFDVVVGTRRNRADGGLRRMFSWGYTLLINLLFGLSLKDIGCGFKLFKREVWVKIQPINSRDHKIFTVEWMWRLKQRGVKIKEVAVTHFSRQGGRPTGARWDVVWQMLKALVALRSQRG